MSFIVNPLFDAIANVAGAAVGLVTGKKKKASGSIAVSGPISVSREPEKTTERTIPRKQRETDVSKALRARIRGGGPGGVAVTPLGSGTGQGKLESVTENLGRRSYKSLLG